MNIFPGLVLFLDPKSLLKNGAICTVPKEKIAQDGRFFLCVEAHKSAGVWIPLFRTPKNDRIALPRFGRNGNEKWVLEPWYYHPDQAWLVTHKAVERASKEDKSTEQERNTLDERLVPTGGDNGMD